MSVALPFDHSTRVPPRRDAIELAHAGRLVSDMLSFTMLRLVTAYRFSGRDLAVLGEQVRRNDDLRKDTTGALHDWLDIEYPQRKPEG